MYLKTVLGKYRISQAKINIFKMKTLKEQESHFLILFTKYYISSFHKLKNSI